MSVASTRRPFTERQRAAGDLPAFPTTTFALAVFASISRGLLELVVGKTAAYGVQLVCIVLFLVVVLLKGRTGRSPLLGLQLTLLWTFIVVALLSYAISANVNSLDYAGVYIAVMIFFSILIFSLSGIQVRFASEGGSGVVLTIAVLSLVAVAFMQQFTGLTLLPGTDLGTFGDTARPASLTGSFLHYPIVLALMSFGLLGIHAVRRRTLYLLVGIIGLAGVVASYSRSGLVIVAVGLFVVVIAAPNLSSRFRMFSGLIIGVATASLFVPLGEYVDRALSIFDIQGAGNEVRIDVWSSVIATWANSSPLLLGSHAGQYTNVVGNLSTVSTWGVAESGLLQILISFGLLGAISFYGQMVVAVLSVPRRPIWFRAAMVGAIFQSFVYQSIEVLSFMFIFAVFPLVARQVSAGSAMPRRG